MPLACRVPANQPSVESREPWPSSSCAGMLPTNHTGKKVGIDFADAIDFRFDFDPVKPDARKRRPPLLRSEEAGIRAKLGIGLDIGETLQDLEHKLRIHGLIRKWANAFADDQPTFRRQNRACLVQAEQQIF